MVIIKVRLTCLFAVLLHFVCERVCKSTCQYKNPVHSNVWLPLSVFVIGSDETASSGRLCVKLVLSSSKLHKGQDLQPGCRYCVTLVYCDNYTWQSEATLMSHQLNLFKPAMNQKGALWSPKMQRPFFRLHPTWLLCHRLFLEVFQN